MASVAPVFRARSSRAGLRSRATIRPGRLGDRPGDHSQPDRSAAGDDDDVLERDPGALDGVQRARERLGKGGMVGGSAGETRWTSGLGGEHHVLGHRPVHPALEAVDRLRLAHPVGTLAAEAAVAARHDLLGDDTVSDGDSPPLGGFVVELDDLADELVSRYDTGFDVAGPRAVAPELGSAVEALQVAGADAHRLNTHERLTLAGFRDRDGLEAVVAWAVAHDGRHRRQTF